MVFDMSYNPNREKFSSVNSSSTLLAASSVFTGEWEDTKLYGSIIVAIAADQNCTIQIQYSTDQSNIDSTLTRYYITSLIEPPWRFTNGRRYFRVVVTNTSSSDMTYMRLQTKLTSTAQQLNAPLDSTLAKDFDAIPTRPTDFRFEVALGRRQGYALWNKFGYNLDIGTSEEIISSWGGTFSRMTTADTLELVSTSSDDDDGQIGAQAVVIYGVDENWDYQIEQINLDGTNPVTTVNQWLGVNRVSVARFGTSEYNQGEITVTASGAGSIQAQMPTGEGTTEQAFFFIPRNHQGLADFLSINAVRFGSGTEPTVTITGWVYSDVSGGHYEVFLHDLNTQVELSYVLNPNEAFVIGEKSLLFFTAVSTRANTAAKCRFSLITARDVDA